jgi:hypothetical protein
MSHEQNVERACAVALRILKVDKNLKFRPMNRKNHVNTKRGFVIGHTNLKTGLITIDIFTPKFRKPKKIASILRILCHEIAHHQKKPYQQRYQGRIITRRHFPVFYRQVTRNIKKLRAANMLS